MVPPLPAMSSGRRRQLLACHRDQELEQLLRSIQIILTRCRPHEKACQHGLAYVHGIEKATKTLILEMEPDLAADEWFVFSHQRQRSLFVPAPNSTNEIAKGMQVRHKSLSQ